MLQLDITGALAKIITPSAGIPDQELTAIRSTMKRHIEDWLKERSRGEHAWSMDPYDKKTVEKVKEAAGMVKANGIETVLWIGIGGDALGPQVMKDVFENEKTLRFVILDSIDPAALMQHLDGLNWKTTFVVIGSKSGATLESMSIFHLCVAKLEEAMKKKAYERIIAITDPEHGYLHQYCLQKAIHMLPIPPAVGGRYSIFTPVGLLAMALLDGDMDRFLRGAKEMDTQCQKTVLEDNPAALLASFQFLLDTKRDCPVRVIMPYSFRLRSIARWNQQLIAESLGKNDSKNPIPLAAVGTQDQHSLLQQWMAGPRKFWHLFIRDVEKPRLELPKKLGDEWAYIEGKEFGELLDACYEGTSRALMSVKRPHVTISVTRLDAYHLGQLFFLLLAEVVFLGKLYRLDPYGQPAVETGKKLTREILEKKTILR